MPFLGTVGDAYDNAMAESVFATLEKERSRPRHDPQLTVASGCWATGTAAGNGHGFPCKDPERFFESDRWRTTAPVRRSRGGRWYVGTLRSHRQDADRSTRSIFPSPMTGKQGQRPWAAWAIVGNGQ
jgi:hypothetical protein